MTELSQWINALVQASLISSLASSDHHPIENDSPTKDIKPIGDGKREKEANENAKEARGVSEEGSGLKGFIH